MLGLSLRLVKRKLKLLYYNYANYSANLQFTSSVSIRLRLI